jgi:hypothetical protein
MELTLEDPSHFTCDKLHSRPKANSRYIIYTAFGNVLFGFA